MADDFFPVAVALELTRQGTTPAAPASGTLALYPKTDNLLYIQTSGGVESPVGSGGSSGGPVAFAFFT